MVKKAEKKNESTEKKSIRENTIFMIKNTRDKDKLIRIYKLVQFVYLD